MSPFPLNIGISILCRHDDGICSVFMILLNNLYRILVRKLPIHVHASAGISSAPTAFPSFHLFCTVRLTKHCLLTYIIYLLFVNQTVCLICVKKDLVQKYTRTNLKAMSVSVVGAKL